MSIDRQTKQKKKAIIEALLKSRGIVSSACAAVDVSRATFYYWINKDEDFKAAVEDTREVQIDAVEGKLFDLIEGVKVMKPTADGDVIFETPPNVTAIIFYLKTIGKKRGYAERATEEAAEGLTFNQVVIKVEASKSPLLKELQARIEDSKPTIEIKTNE